MCPKIFQKGRTKISNPVQIYPKNLHSLLPSHPVYPHVHMRGSAYVRPAVLESRSLVRDLFRWSKKPWSRQFLPTIPRTIAPSSISNRSLLAENSRYTLSPRFYSSPRKFLLRDKTNRSETIYRRGWRSMRRRFRPDRCTLERTHFSAIDAIFCRSPSHRHARRSISAIRAPRVGPCNKNIANRMKRVNHKP